MDIERLLWPIECFFENRNRCFEFNLLKMERAAESPNLQSIASGILLDYHLFRLVDRPICPYLFLRMGKRTFPVFVFDWTTDYLILCARPLKTWNARGNGPFRFEVKSAANGKTEAHFFAFKNFFGYSARALYVHPSGRVHSNVGAIKSRKR